MHKVTEVTVMDDYQLGLTFADGVRGTVDLSPLVRKGVFTAWQDYEVFRTVQIGCSGELTWGEQIDLCPDSLYLEVTGQVAKDVFPALKHERTHALDRQVLWYRRQDVLQ
jgi:hypothetical protein